MDKDDYLTLEQASKEYHWSRPMLYKLRKQGKLTFYSIPGTRQTLLLRSELAALAQPRAK